MHIGTVKNYSKSEVNFFQIVILFSGNHSFIEVLGEGKKELPLYGSGGFRYVIRILENKETLILM